jgi:hypothetical protein
MMGASTAGAQAPSQNGVTREEIQQLREEIAVMQRRLDGLLARVESNGHAEAPVAVTPVAMASTVTATAAPTAAPAQAAGQIPGQGQTDRGLYGGLAAGPPGQRYGRGLFGDTVKIGGYGSFRFESNNIDLGPRIGNLPPIQRGFNAFDFRRFVLTLDATPTDRLRVYTELEFERFNKIEVERTAIPENRGSQNRAGTRFIEEVEGQGGSELAMEQAWVQYDFSRSLGLRMGVILPPVGRFNILHDDDYWDLPRRPLVDRGGPVLPVKSAWRELGAGLVGNIPLGQGYLDYQIYGVGGAKLDFALEKVVSLRQGRNLLEVEPEISFASGPFNGTDPTDSLTWRVAFSPKLGSEIALSGYHGRYTPGYLNVDASVHSLGLDGKLTLGRFEAEGEFVYTDFGRMEEVLQDVAAQAVNAAAETSSVETATLESEVAAEFAGPFTNQRFGYWVDFKYRFWPRFLSQTFLGRGFENPQLIPIVRLERIWFNDFISQFTFAGGRITGLQKENMEQQRISLGLTYRPAVSVAFTAAYERSQRIQGSTLIFPRVLGLGRVPDKSYDALVLGAEFGF